MSPFMLDFVNPFWCESVLTFPAETNSAYNPGQYSCMVQAAVEDYRQIWRIRGAPLYFGFFQMPSVRWIVHLQFALNSVVTWIPLTLSRLIPPTVLTWAVHIIRWKQTNEIGYLPNERMPNTFMAVTHDLYGVRGDAHEIEKQPWVKRIIPGTLQQNSYHFKNICFTCHPQGLWIWLMVTSDTHSMVHFPKVSPLLTLGKLWQSNMTSPFCITTTLRTLVSFIAVASRLIVTQTTTTGQCCQRMLSPLKKVISGLWWKYRQRFAHRSKDFHSGSAMHSTMPPSRSTLVPIFMARKMNSRHLEQHGGRQTVFCPFPHMHIEDFLSIIWHDLFFALFFFFSSI